MVNEKEVFRDVYNVYLKYKDPDANDPFYWSELLNALCAVISKHGDDELAKDLAASVYCHLERKSVGGDWS